MGDWEAETEAGKTQNFITEKSFFSFDLYLNAFFAPSGSNQNI